MTTQAMKVITDRFDAITIITLNAPNTLNAASIAMVETLSATLDEAARTSRCIVLTGKGRAFCSGADLGSLDYNTAGYDPGAYLESHYNPLIRQFRDSPVPIITAVNGAAVGIGASVALMGDLIVASEAAYFLQPFRNIGLVPDGGAASILIATVGRARASEMMLLAERINADTALAWGMINRIVAAEALLSSALDYARKLAAGPAATGMIRRIAWDACDHSFEYMLAQERQMQQKAGRTIDHREGVAAFMGKRAPNFRGR